MAYKLDDTNEGFTESLSLFSVPPVDTGLLRIHWQEFHPVSPLNKGSPIQFTVPPTSSEYVDLKRTTLNMKVRIIRPDGSPVSADDDVTFSNLTAHSIIKQMDVSLQHQVISPNVGINYAYKAYIDRLMGNSEDIKETKLQSELFYKDTSRYHGSNSPKSGENMGLGQRYQLTSDGNSVDMSCSILMDICQQKRLILSSVQIDFKMFPNADGFALISSGTIPYQYEIEEAVLKVCKVQVHPGVIVGHAKALKSTTAKYPLEKSHLISFQIPKGSYEWSTDDLFQGNVPNNLIVGLTSGKGYSGSMQSNPYCFDHYNVNYMSFNVDGESVPTNPFTMQYNKGKYINAYLSMFSSTDRGHTNSSNYISRDEYPYGNCIYQFNLHESDDNFITLLKKGHTRLIIRFAEALKETVTVIAYAKFPSIVQLDEARNILN